MAFQFVRAEPFKVLCEFELPSSISAIDEQEAVLVGGLGLFFFSVCLDLVQILECAHFYIFHLNDHELLGLNEGPKEVVNQYLMLVNQGPIFGGLLQDFGGEIPVLTQQWRDSVNEDQLNRVFLGLSQLHQDIEGLPPEFNSKHVVLQAIEDQGLLRLHKHPFSWDLVHHGCICNVRIQ